MEDYLNRTKEGFTTLPLDQKYKDAAIGFIQEWLTDSQFQDYLPQLKHLIDSKDWDYLLDCFYQIIPFGTGGRRGEVGIGPNRINKWTIQASAQGHSQYLLKNHGEQSKSRGVALTFGVREFFTNKHFNDGLPNPVKNLKGSDLAYAAAQVYCANGITTYLFDSPRTTPELSFAIRYLKTIAGDMFDASHNPPEHNGKKVYDEFGGQLIPPYDENLVKEVTENVSEIKTITIDEAKNIGFLKTVGTEVDEAYISSIANLSLSSSRNIKIAFTPLHGVGSTSILRCLQKLGFEVLSDPKTSNQSGKFENVTFNIPNPEVIQSFDTTLVFAKEIDANILLNSDPDADRIGVMVNHQGDWKFLNGNEIGAILMNFVIHKRKDTLKGQGVAIKSSVTTNLAAKICEANNVKIIGELPVGFKYIGEEMNKLEKSGEIDNFLLGLEESHGYIAGNYLRDKDGAIAGLWLAELAAELKEQNKTLVDYLNETYITYGYFMNYLTEIRLPGAEGMTQIKKIQDTLRSEKITYLGDYEIEQIEDFWERKPIVSETDKVSKDVLVFHLKPFENYISAKITLRPSGTEPKAKMYFEVGNLPCTDSELLEIQTKTAETLKKLEKLFMIHCYKVLGVNFPERGFLLFWQIPLKDKMKYFEIEDEIAHLTEITDLNERKEKLDKLLEFLGSDPIQKVDKAFAQKFGHGIQEYLSL